jgi:hypothetical protein
VFVPKERDKEKNVKKLATKAMSLFVKYYELMNAHGTTAPDLYVIGVESMGPEEFIVEKVPALSSGTHAGAFGYVVLMKNVVGMMHFSNGCSQYTSQSLLKVLGKHTTASKRVERLQSGPS